MNKESSYGFKLIRILPFLLAASLIFTPLATAQLGEIAGQLNFQVQIGHNETIQLHLLNEGNSSIGVQVTAQNVQFSSNKTTQANQITPTVHVYPENLTVPAYGTSAVNVTVSMPLSNRPNWASWETILSAQETSNATNPGGAVILQGVAKLVAISAIPSTTTTTTIPTTIAQSGFGGLGPLSQVALPIGVLLVIIIIAIAYYYSSRAPKGKKSKAKSPVRAEKMSDIEILRRENARQEPRRKEADKN